MQTWEKTVSKTVLVFDIETNGFLDQTTTLHSLVIKDANTGEMWSYRPGRFHEPFEKGLRQLEKAAVIVGHNIIGFDIPAIQKLYPWFQPKGIVLDTLVLTRLLWPSEQIKDMDFKAAERGFPKNLIGVYSLEAWGYRLGNYKGDFKGPYDTWTPEMQAYCEQDVEVTTTLWKRCAARLDEWGLDPFDPAPPAGKDAVELEHKVAWILARQERRGFAFDTTKARTLYGKLLARYDELSTQLSRVFQPDVLQIPFTPKRDNKKKGWRAGETIYREKIINFNPSSRPQVAKRLMALGWEPVEMTDNGQPKVDDDILNSLPYPEAKLLAEYYMVEKRLAQLGEGRQALMRAERKGRIHGRVITNGAVTGRMIHSNPNIAQVPSNGAPYGEEFRSLFGAGPGYVLVGCDADALELRCLAHFMARYDQGAYVKTILEGNKAEGTDMHTLNAQALGCSRDVAKTWFYAFIYGAGDWKLGFTLTGQRTPKKKIIAIGKRGREAFLEKLPAMGRLVKAVKRIIEGKKDRNGATVTKGRNYLVGLDGRRVFIRGAHAALNTLLQSAGALVMKRALVLLDDELGLLLYTPDHEYGFVANVHDEWQIEVQPQLAERVGQHAAASIARAGEFYSFLCPLAGNYVVGTTWASTH